MWIGKLDTPFFDSIWNKNFYLITCKSTDTPNLGSLDTPLLVQKWLRNFPVARVGTTDTPHPRAPLPPCPPTCAAARALPLREADQLGEAFLRVARLGACAHTRELARERSTNRIGAFPSAGASMSNTLRNLYALGYCNV
jgi:hypothetical protein